MLTILRWRWLNLGWAVSWIVPVGFTVILLMRGELHAMRHAFARTKHSSFLRKDSKPNPEERREVPGSSGELWGLSAKIAIRSVIYDARRYRLNSLSCTIRGILSCLPSIMVKPHYEEELHWTD